MQIYDKKTLSAVASRIDKIIGERLDGIARDAGEQALSGKSVEYQKGESGGTHRLKIELEAMLRMMAAKEGTDKTERGKPVGGSGVQK